MKVGVKRKPKEGHLKSTGKKAISRDLCITHRLLSHSLVQVISRALAANTSGKVSSSLPTRHSSRSGSFFFLMPPRPTEKQFLQQKHYKDVYTKHKTHLCLFHRRLHGNKLLSSISGRHLTLFLLASARHADFTYLPSADAAVRAAETCARNNRLNSSSEERRTPLIHSSLLMASSGAPLYIMCQT